MIAKPCSEDIDTHRHIQHHRLQIAHLAYRYWTYTVSLSFKATTYSGLIRLYTAAWLLIIVRNYFGRVPRVTVPNPNAQLITTFF